MTKKKNDQYKTNIAQMESVYIPLVYVFIVAFILSIVSISRHLKEEIEHKRFEKRVDGHLCKRMFTKNYITALDRKFLNRGWYITQNLTRANDSITRMYNRDFHLIEDRDIDFESIVPKVKQIVTDIRENGDRCILRDYMEIVKDHVDTSKWLKDEHRKYVWDSYWSSIE